MKSINKSLSVIIPFYNEEKTIKKLLKKVLVRPEVYEVVVVDDGSTDNSLLEIMSLGSSKIKIVRHEKNRGKGAAMTTGLKKAKGHWIIFQDADLELYPSDYPKFLKILKSGGADFVIGNRWPENKGYFWPRLGNRFLNTLINILFSTNFADAYCGYKAASRKVWESLDLHSPRFEIEAEIASKVALKKHKMCQVSIRYQPRSYKEGKKIKAKDAFVGAIKVIHLRAESLWNNQLSST